MSSVALDRLSVSMVLVVLAAGVLAVTPSLPGKTQKEIKWSFDTPGDVIPALKTSQFKLTLPVDDSGQDSTFSDDLASRNTDPRQVIGEFVGKLNLRCCFYAIDKEVVMRAACRGATTSGSNYPRCELRQRVGNGDNYFNMEDPQRFVASMRVTQLPVYKKQVIIFQIHANSDEGGGQPIAIYCDGDANGSGNTGLYFLYNENHYTRADYLPYSIGNGISINCEVNNMIVNCTMTNTTSGESKSISLTSAYKSGTFQFGVYTQASIFQSEISGGATDEPYDSAGEVRLESVEITETSVRNDPDLETLPPVVDPGPGLIT